MFQSVRMCCWLYLTGEVTEVTQLLQLPADGVTFGEGYSLRYAWPAGLSRSAGIWLPGNGAPVSGSFGIAGEQPSIRGPLKSPLRSASVGTNAVRAVPRSSMFHSSEPKKNSLSLMNGPPNDPPKSLRFNSSFGWFACSRK